MYDIKIKCPESIKILPEQSPDYITSAEGMFEGVGGIESDMSQWETGHIKNMNKMFKFADGYNQDLSKWEVSQIPSKPFEFDRGVNTWSLPQPNWRIQEGTKPESYMEILQEFALENIYCAPWEDRQFRFSLNRITKPENPVKTIVSLFNRQLVYLPDDNNYYHVYTIGRTPSTFLNLQNMGGCCACAHHDWVNMEDDINERYFIFQMYDDTGLNLPRRNIYYRISREGFLIFAVKIDHVIDKLFNIDDFKYIRTYTNHYYKTETSDDTITIKSALISGKKELIELERFVESMNPRGEVIYYINGKFSDKLDPDVTGDVFVEVFHDTGIRRIEKFKINDLTTFISEKDKRMKYFVFRDKYEDYIQYSDDLEVYIVGQDKKKRNRGLYYYQNKDEALRNVTDKDYSLVTDYVNYHARLIAEENKTGLQENYIFMLIRDPMFRRSLVYSALKIHELYKLPSRIEKNVMNNTGYSIHDFRVETLENSNYWTVAGMDDLKDLTKQLAMDTVGYSAALFYYGNTPSKVNNLNVQVPYLYQSRSYGYEYNKHGVMTDYQETLNPYYPLMSEDTQYVEFLQGRKSTVKYLYNTDDIVYVDTNRDFRIICAIHYQDTGRGEEWRDITEDESLVTIDKDGRVNMKGNEFNVGKYRIIYLDEPYVAEFALDFKYYFPVFTLHVNEVTNGKELTVPVDYYFDTLEVFLNGHRLTQDVDYFMDFPTISIVNKSYLQYEDLKQIVHVRGTGVSLRKEDINRREIRGFVNHGALARNKYYDIRDDRVFSVFVDGKLYPRDKIIFADEDNTVRIADPLNGKPYTICDKIVSIKPISGLPTYPAFRESYALNDRISGLYNIIYPEPDIDTYNVIGERHYIFSPLISRIIRDVIDGRIPPEFYTRYYQSIPIRDMLDKNYELLMRLDPLNNDIPHKLVEVHPDYGNDEIEVNVFQYRFIYNVVKVLTENQNELVNLSGYLYVNKDLTDEVDEDEVHKVDFNNTGLTPFD